MGGVARVKRSEDQRINFGKIKLGTKYPDFFEIQIKVIPGVLSTGNNS